MQIAALCGAFFLSGISALILETLWLRLSGLAFGNAAVSAALVLSGFMAGLALGGGIAGLRRPTRTRPLRLYLILELTIALLGVSLVFLLPSVGAWTRPVLARFWMDRTSLHFLRFVLALVLLIVPSTAMGATLPVAMADPIFQRRAFARSVALFYGFNTLGAVIGALAGEAFLIRLAGLGGTAIVAGILNCLAAGTVLVLITIRPILPEPATTHTPASLAAIRRCWRLLAISFGCGALLLSLEVAWFRFLRLYVLSSPLAFAVMLAVVLAGMGLGSLCTALFSRGGNSSSRAIRRLLLLGGVLALLSYAFFPITFLQTKASASWRDFMLDSWWEIGVLSLALMFPTAFVSGALFPRVVAALDEKIGNRMNSAGLATLLNTVGAAAGPIVATFILLPLFGFERTLVLSAAAYGLLSLLAIEGRAIPSQRLPLIIDASLGIIFLASLIFFPYQRDAEHFEHARSVYEQDGSYLIDKREGLADTWQLLRRDFLGQPYYCRLMSDAFSMSSTQYPSQRYMRLFAYLPLALETRPQNALLICYGCGVTADALTKDNRLEHIDVVDSSKEVLELADRYPGPSPLRDRRVTTFVEDGRFFLQASGRQYDVITGEPPPPKVQGTVNLYTREFFQLMNSRLKDGGIATFWLPIYQLTIDDTKAILRAFHEAFPQSSLWASSDEDWIMLGIKGTAAPAAEASDHLPLWDNGIARADLMRIGIETPAQLASLFLMDASGLEELTKDSAPLTDWFPKRLSEDRVDRRTTHAFARPFMEAEAAARRFRDSGLMHQIWPDDIRAEVSPFFVVREIRYRSGITETNKLSELDYFLRKTKLEIPVLEVFQTDADRVAIAEHAAQSPATAPDEALPDLVAGAVARRDFTEAISMLERERTNRTAKRNDLLLLIYLQCQVGKVEDAERVAATSFAGTTKDWLMTWLWGKLQAEFGFHPPA